MCRSRSSISASRVSIGPDAPCRESVVVGSVVTPEPGAGCVAVVGGSLTGLDSALSTCNTPPASAAGPNPIPSPTTPPRDPSAAAPVARGFRASISRTNMDSSSSSDVATAVPLVPDPDPVPSNDDTRGRSRSRLRSSRSCDVSRDSTRSATPPMRPVLPVLPSLPGPPAPADPVLPPLAA